MTQIQNQMAQFDYEAEERNPTYINFIENKEYEPVEYTEIRIEAYNNNLMEIILIFLKCMRRKGFQKGVMDFKKNYLGFKNLIKYKKQ